MLPDNTLTSAPPNGRRSLQQIRREAGYRSAKEFAFAQKIPYTTYARYEAQEDGPERAMPMQTAWKLADALGCSIDRLVGRSAQDSPGTRVQRMYDALTPGSRERFDEFMDFIQYREHMLAGQGKWS